MKNIVFSTRNIDDFISDLADEVIKKIELHKSFDRANNPTYISRLDLAKGNWSGGFKMTPPTQDKYRRDGLLKPVRIGGKIFYRESDLLNFGGTNKKRLNDGK